ncbi:MAG: hypothetical protein HFJ10_11910 [Lachnospiraceae bacterium]|jgi:hypothetical protein|nr:hypothetical protein [Lachnospiraceae bacterium]
MNEVKNDFILMISGESVVVKLQEYIATAKELNTRDQIYSTMVVYGLLTYENGRVLIPNKELTAKYTGRILLIGISYNRKTKEHYCKIETEELKP